MQRFSDSKCTRKETVDNILITTILINRKVMQPIRTMSDKKEPQEQGI